MQSINNQQWDKTFELIQTNPPKYPGIEYTRLLDSCYDEASKQKLLDHLLFDYEKNISRKFRNSYLMRWCSLYGARDDIADEATTQDTRESEEFLVHWAVKIGNLNIIEPKLKIYKGLIPALFEQNRKFIDRISRGERKIYHICRCCICRYYVWDIPRLLKNPWYAACHMSTSVGLDRHLQTIHNNSDFRYKDPELYYTYYRQFDTDNILDSGCCANCGNSTEFVNLTKGYKKYCSNRCSQISRIYHMKPNRGEDENACLDILEDVLHKKVMRQHSVIDERSEQIKGLHIDGLVEGTNLLIEFNEPPHYKKDGTLKKKDLDRISFLEFQGYKVFSIKQVEWNNGMRPTIISDFLTEVNL